MGVCPHTRMRISDATICLDNLFPFVGGVHIAMQSQRGQQVNFDFDFGNKVTFYVL